MNRILKKFLQRGVDLSPVGVELREDNTNYFCTPKGASVFGWAGIDGIHFCFIRGFGEMVFSVSPMNTSPDYVHPVAENFTDFLRLILACGDVAAVEQAWMWNEAQFEAFLNENPTTQEQQQTLSEISEKMNLLPMEQPWTYIKNLQSSFDYSQIKYTEDYYDNDMTSEAELVAPEWKVYFDGDFWGHRGKDRAGKEIKLDKQFDWAGYPSTLTTLPDLSLCPCGVPKGVPVCLSLLSWAHAPFRWFDCCRLSGLYHTFRNRGNF